MVFFNGNKGSKLLALIPCWKYRKIEDKGFYKGFLLIECKDTKETEYNDSLYIEQEHHLFWTLVSLL